MSALLIRIEHNECCVRGFLYYAGNAWATLERPWLFNRRNESCIPTGEYDVQFLLRSASGRYRDVFYLPTVPKRSGILIHKGNLARETQGCILIGKKWGTLAGQPAILNSAEAMSELHEATNKSGFKLIVV